MSSDTRLINHWNEYYKKDGIPSHPSPFAKYVANQLNAEQNILEIGCGNGRDAKFFSAQGHNVTGIDRSTEAIDLCKKLYSEERIEFCFGTIADIAKKNQKKYDLVYTRFVIHAMSMDEEIKTLKMSYKLLKSNGKFFIECRSINDPLSERGEIVSQTERIDGHYRRFIILEEFTERLTQIGFKITEAIESKGLAKFAEEDPMIIRVSALKSSAVK